MRPDGRAEDYLSQCLYGIPKSKYRERLRGELAEHLTLLESDLEAAGRPPEEAQSEALRQMGDADALNAGYRAAWLRQPERLCWDLGRTLFAVYDPGADLYDLFFDTFYLQG